MESLNEDNGHVPILDDNPTEKKHSDERWYVILIQVVFPFFIAGFGMVGAGVVLDIVQVS